MLKHKRQGGVALVEVLVSVLLLAVGILGVIGLQGMLVQAATDNRNRATATLLAGEVISGLWVNTASSDFSALSGPLSSDNPSAARIMSSLPNGTATVTGDAGGTVTVAITWQMPNATTPSTVTQTAVVMNENKTLIP